MHFQTVISLCDGISLAWDSLAAAGIGFDEYIAVEIDDTARRISEYRIGNKPAPRAPVIRPAHDICNYLCAPGDAAQFANKDILIIAGIPCTERSTANNKHSGVDRVAEDTDSGLIRDFRRTLHAVTIFARRVEFIVENVPSAGEADSFYSDTLGVMPVCVNAAAFSAQHRERLFWASWGVEPPTEWSDEVFADIAESNPPDAQYYDFIYYPSEKIRKGKPHRLGVLPVPAVLRQIQKSAASGLPDGGVGTTIAESNTKMYAVKSSNGSQAKISCAGAGALTVNNRDEKMRAVRAHHSGGARQLIGAHRVGLEHTGEETSAVADRGGKTRPITSGRKSMVATADGGQIVKREEDGVEMREFKIDGQTLLLPVVINGARALTITEIERLFGLPDGDTAAPDISKTGRIRALGGGWHVLQMAHCLRALHNYRPAEKHAPLFRQTYSPHGSNEME